MAKRLTTTDQNIMRAASDLLSRQNIATRAGLMFDTARDLYKVYGYRRELVYQDFFQKYQRQDIAARIVDAPVQATWRREPKIFDDTGPDGTWTKEWEVLVRKHKLYFNLERADRLAGLGQFSCLLLGYPGDLLIQPPKNRDLMFLQPFSQDNVDIVSFEQSITNPRYGKPLTYEITLTDLSQLQTDSTAIRTGKTQRLKVNWSRMLHIAESSLEDEVYGLPKLMKVFNLLDDMLKISGGSAETFWLTANRGMQFDIDKEATLSDDDEEALADEIEEYFHHLRRFIRTRGVKIQSLGSEVANPEGVFAVLIALIAGATGIPVRILLGSERGELASEQDRSNWANRIEERQKHYATPIILEPLIDRFIEFGTLSAFEGELQIIWPDAFAPSPLERAQTMAQKARAAVNFTKALENKAAFITSDESREMLGLQPGVNASELPDGDVDVPDEDAEGQRAAGGK